jgi:RHS repeat-associated protein
MVFKRETDGLGRLIKVTEQDVSTGLLTQETTYSYNLLDKLTGVNQGGQTRAYKYDAIGRLLYERIPEQTATINDGTGTMWSCKYTYTEFGTVATKQEARGVITTFTYDALHHVTQKSYNTSGAPGVAATSSVTFTWASSDTLSSVSTGGYGESTTFDAYGRPASMTETIDGRSYTTSYQYNGGSQIATLTHPSGYAVNFSYDDKGRLSGMPYYLAYPQTYGGPLAGVTYNVAGQVTALTLDSGGQVNPSIGIQQTFTYDSNRLQLTSQVATRVGGPTGGLMNLTYYYQASAGQMGAASTAGNAGQLMAINNTSTINGTPESANYTYDDLGRLVTSSQTSNGASAQRRFAYDRWGNRTQVYDAMSGGTLIQNTAWYLDGGVTTNRLAVVSDSTFGYREYTYDAAGNVTNDLVHTYQYDAENRLVSVDGGATATYSYDHQNRRVKKLAGGANTHYIWAGSQVIAEHDGNTRPDWAGSAPYGQRSSLVDYIYIGSRLISSRQYTHPCGTNYQDSQNYSCGTSSHCCWNWTDLYYLSDRLSTRLVLDASGNVMGRQGHLPFGEDFAESGIQEKHNFTSYERDGESGTDYAVNRGYSTSLGRFNQVDPVNGSTGDARSWNRYAYAHDSPINNTDRLGLYDAGPTSGCTSGFVNGNTCTSCAQRIGDQVVVTIRCTGAASPPPFGNTIVVNIPPIPTPGGPGNRSNEPLPNDLRARLRRLLEKNNNECGNFVQNLINQVANDTGRAYYSDYLLDLFDRINGPEGGGYVLEDVVIEGRSAGGTVRGDMGNKPTVVISPLPYSGYVYDSYTHTALHETLHLAAAQGWYSDKRLADAVFNLEGGNMSQADIDEYKNIKDEWDASRFWDKFLSKHCR